MRRSKILKKVGRALWQIGEEAEGEDRYAYSLLIAHFAGFGSDQIVTTSRSFPTRSRVDLQRALDNLLSGWTATCVGVRNAWSHQTLDYASLLSRSHDRIAVTPLRFEDVDIGEEEPVRCLRNALWLAERAGTRFALLLSPDREYGCVSGWHVEVAVPAGVRGEALTASLFKELEERISEAASYRGKALSLEQESSSSGTVGSVLVHRLAPVAREEVVLPAATLRLLERNVFRFVSHRERLRGLGMPTKKGLLFYGPPGTGKTHTIRYLAGTLPGHTTLIITAEQVALLGEYMSLARLLQPALVVIEDVDLIAREREHMRGAGEEVLLNRLLNEMDGLRENTDILFVLTTNRPQVLEGALASRPGRVDQAVEFPLPDDDGRRKLIALYARGAKVPDEVLEHLVARTEGTSASFIKELMRRVAQFSFERAPDASSIVAADVDAAIDELLFSGGTLNASLLGAGEASALAAG